MQAVIIAGGLGKRLRPLTLTRPKALVPLVNKPQVVHILEALPPSCEEAILAVNYRFVQVRDFFREHEFRVKVRVVDEPTPLGTGGALRNVEPLVHGTFTVYNGDVVDSIDFDALVRAHRKGRGIGTIALRPVDDPSAFGVVEVAAGRVTRFVEKPAPGETASHLVNAGRYVFEPEVFDFIAKGVPVSLEREVFPRLIERGLTAYPFEGWWSDAGTLSNYLKAQQLLLAAGHGKIAPDVDVTSAMLQPPVAIGPGSFVEGRLGPDAVLGRSCKIGRAVVRNAALLDGVSVDDKAEVLGSIIGQGASVGEGARVRDSILQDGVQVAPHAEIIDDRVAA
jgi:mannose-1-phosphate guanylyltransferase